MAHTFEEVFENGIRAAKDERPSDAKACFEKAIELEPDNPYAWGQLGDALLDLDRSEDAIRAFERAMKIDPTIGVHYSGLGVALMETGQYDAAITALMRSVELDPKASVYTLLADALSRGGRLDDAERALHAALKLEPGYDEAVAGLEDIHRYRKAHDRL